MKTETIPQATETAKASETTTRPETLEQIIDRVARDAQHESQRYLDEVVVPDGGE